MRVWVRAGTHAIAVPVLGIEGLEDRAEGAAVQHLVNLCVRVHVCVCARACVCVLVFFCKI